MPGRLQTQQPFECFNTRLPWPVTPQQPQVLATASYDDVQRKGQSLLLATLDRLHHQRRVSSLCLIRSQRQDAWPPQERLLADVATLAGFDLIRGFTCGDQRFREGGEWRAAPIRSFKGVVSDADVFNNPGSSGRAERSLQVAAIESQDYDLCLVLHGLGQPALVLASVPRAYPMQSSFQTSPASTSTGQSTPIEDMMRCVLCDEDFESYEEARSACLFHPGRKDWLEDSESESGSSESSYDDLPHDELFNWTCCGRRGNLSGCTPEVEHVLARRSDLAGQAGRREWRASWQ